MITMQVSVEVLDDIGMDRLRPPAAKARVRIVGPLDEKTCGACVEFIGNEYAYDDPRIQCFVNGAGLHPNCRHWAEEILPDEPAPAPELPPGEPPVATGEEYVERLLDAGNVDALAGFFGQKRAAALLDGVVDFADLYEKDGTLKTVEKILALVARREP